MAIDRADTFAKIATLIAQQLHIDESRITEESTMDTLGADSLDRVEIIMKLEEEFDIEIDDAVAEKLATMRQLVDYIHGLRVH